MKRPAAAQQPLHFAVAAPPARAWLALVGLGGLLPLLALGTAALLDPGARTGLGAAWPVLVLAPLLLAGLSWAMRRRRVELRHGVLDVRAAMYRKQVPVARLDLARARVVDLAERTELRPLLKTNGMALPGFHAGHFRLRGKLGKAFCLVTDRQRVLWLPLQGEGQQLLLSVVQPQALLDALRAEAR